MLPNVRRAASGPRLAIGGRLTTRSHGTATGTMTMSLFGNLLLAPAPFKTVTSLRDHSIQALTAYNSAVFHNGGHKQLIRLPLP